MDLSEKEERDRLKALEEANQRSLFDDGLQTLVPILMLSECAHRL
jgi:hypothetical protein